MKNRVTARSRTAIAERLRFISRPVFGRSPDASALLQEMSAERHNRIAGVQSGDHSGFAGYMNKLDGLKLYGRGCAVQDPNAGLLTVIEHGSQRHLDFRLACLPCKPNGYRRAKRCCRGLTVEHITGLIGTGLGIGGV